MYYNLYKPTDHVCCNCRTVNGADTSSERCRELMRTLQMILSWLRTTRQRMRHQQSLGGDFVSLQRQCDELAVVQLQ